MLEHRVRGKCRAWTRRLGAIVMLGVGLTITSMSPSYAYEPVRPIMHCVTVDEQTGLVTAYFGYENADGSRFTILHGEDNFFIPFPPVREGLPNTFEPGLHENVFSVTFNPAVPNNEELAWSLYGFPAVATPASRRCGSPPTVTVRDFSFKCYDAKGPRIGETVKLEDRFEQAPRNAIVAGPVQLCNAVEVTRQNGQVIENPDTSVSFTCYELAQSATKLPGVQASNAFGQGQTLSIGKPRTVCVPNQPAG